MWSTFSRILLQRIKHDTNWLRYIFSSHLIKIWLSVWCHHLANLHILKTWISLEQKEIFEYSKQHFSYRLLVQFWTPRLSRNAGERWSRIICLRMLALNQSQHTLRQRVCFAAKSKNWRENYSSTLQEIVWILQNSADEEMISAYGVA